MLRKPALTALLALALCTPAQAAWTNLGTDPDAAAQPATSWGVVLSNLVPWNNKLYVGFGDYGANTGPIAIRPYTGSAFGSVEFSADTEAIYGYRVLGGALYAPSIDPRVNQDYAVNNGTGWVGVDAVASDHVYDMAQVGTDLFICGASGENAVVWRSTDGVTWSVSLSEGPVNAGDSARYYGCLTLNGALYVAGHDVGGPNHATQKWDGSTWSATAANLFIPTEATPYNATYSLFKSGYPGAYQTGVLKKFDGTVSNAFGTAQIYDFAVAGSTVYVVDSAETVWKSTDLVTWTTVAGGPRGTRSIGVLNGSIYVGTTTSKLYRFH